MDNTRSTPRKTRQDNSAQRKDPVAKELRFDRVTKKVNKNHTRVRYGGQEKATKEEEHQKPKDKRRGDERRCEVPEKKNQSKGTDARETEVEESREHKE